jgi:hypothetical protein
MRLQILFDIIFGTIMIAFIHFLVVFLSPGPMPQELKDLLQWFM